MGIYVAVDVLIPAFNAERTIVASIKSIMNQTFSDLNIIVVNDGSTDSTGEKLSALAKEDSRIKIIRTENNGIVSALNTGLDACTASIVARHDADDIAFPDRLQAQIGYLFANPACVAVGANVWHIDGDGKRLGSTSGFRGDVDYSSTSVPSKEPYLLHPFVCVRRDALSSVGGYRYVFHSEDTDLYWRLLRVGKLHNLETKLGEYRIHENSISSASIQNGRIAATYSQLAAISRERQLQHLSDLTFTREDLPKLTVMSSLNEVVDFASRNLTSKERDWLLVASAAKLIEIASYRRYVLSASDCKFIKDALRKKAGLISASDMRRAQRYEADLIVRYVRERNFAQVWALRPSLFVFGIIAKRSLSGLRAGRLVGQTA
jgi:glycosyltransferase involved in cell wall biosynthesis